VKSRVSDVGYCGFNWLKVLSFVGVGNVKLYEEPIQGELPLTGRKQFFVGQSAAVGSADRDAMGVKPSIWKFRPKTDRNSLVVVML
jgi:hypothetical protein